MANHKLDKLDAFDLLTGAVPPPSGEPRKKLSREVVRIDAALVQRARDCVRFLRAHGQPDVMLVDILDAALARELDRIAGELNAGEPFPETGPLPRGGHLRRR